ncbi:hypothetical protein T4E_4201 [Trichinella pseudospiralis]|uniref:Uncharacterized protein n=1 Tax=Trichinella pseudospiralis TaxID=6337 RepID=A0A0V0XE03_TRIPS|nr:hypothetical protein T4E_7324 [Trichinella pseudospiralis]KRX86521.1 hypothetical protein T4E_3816 [Trichinella pseudospiralis]KRX86524.1 hypothetical protein T4E_4201 [Trichinella pseudospiralis]
MTHRIPQQTKARALFLHFTIRSCIVYCLWITTEVEHLIPFLVNILQYQSINYRTACTSVIKKYKDSKAQK